MKIILCDELDKGKVIRTGDLIIVGIKLGTETYDISECYIELHKGVSV